MLIYVFHPSMVTQSNKSALPTHTGVSFSHISIIYKPLQFYSDQIILSISENNSYKFLC